MPSSSRLFLVTNAPRGLLALVFALSLVSSALLGGTGCNGGKPTVLEEFSEAKRLTADLRIQFNKAVAASNRAVLADTDEASIASAQEAEQLAKVVDRNVAALAPILRSLSLAEELKSFDQFSKQYAEYRKVDGTVLAFAAENSNLKAQRLSFGPAKEAADRFKSALHQLSPELASNDRCRAEALAANAVLNVREIQTLLGPHIAAAEDPAMAALETEIATLEGKTTEALSALSGLVEPSSLGTAQQEFEQFKGVAVQITALSRRNTNVRSLDLSLRVKPPLTAACDESLRALQAALEKERFQGTR